MKEYLKNIKYTIKQKTYLFYLQICEIYMARFSGDLASENLNKFILLLQEKLSYSTTKMVKSLINRSLKFACKNGTINETIQITIPLKNKPLRKVEALEKCKQTKIEKYILENKKHYRYGILICLFTGLRLGELVALKWQNVISVLYGYKESMQLATKTIFLTVNLCLV